MPVYNADTSLLMGYPAPQLNPVPERMGKILTLADMMDKRKAYQKQQEAEEILRSQAQKQIEARNAPLPPEPVQPERLTVDPNEIYGQVSKTNIIRPGVYKAGAFGTVKDTSPIAPDLPEQQQQLSDSIKSKYGVDITPETIAQVQGNAYSEDPYKTVYGDYGTVTEPNEGMTEPMPQDQFGQLPQFQTEPGQPILPTAESSMGMESAQAQTDYENQLAEYQAAKEAQKAIPASHQWMGDDYETFQKLMAVDPGSAKAFRKELLDEKKIQADMTKTEAEVLKLKADANKEQTDKNFKTNVLKHDRISNMIKSLYGSVDPETGAAVEPDPSTLQARWPGIIRQARSYGISEDLLPTAYDPVSAQNFITETKAAKGSLKTDPQFAREDKLRDDFWTKSKSYVTVRDASDAIKKNNAVQQAMEMKGENYAGSPADQMALIYQYMKAMDPGSVVRESEFRMAANQGSLPVKAQNWMNSIMSGQTLLASQVREILTASQNSYKSYRSNWNNQKKYYGELATNYGLDPENVTGGFDYRAPKQDPSNYPVIKTQAEYDALKKGDIYVDTDGLTKRKK